MLLRLSILRLRQRSLARGVLLALGALAASLWVAGYPFKNGFRAGSWQILILPIVCLAMADTFRCLRSRWSLYHAGVLILLYSELMILALVLFLWIYP